MARLTIKIDLEDINTRKIGNNILIQCENNIDIIFTPESIFEIIKDLNTMKTEDYKNMRSNHLKKSGE